MKTLARNWKAVLALILLVASVAVYFRVYRPAEETYQRDKDMLNQQITVMQSTIAENAKYKDVREQLPAEYEKLAASRDTLYASFPDEMKEEDQLLYLLYLERIFADDLARLGFTETMYLNGGQNVFQFGVAEPILSLSDGSSLQALDIVISYSATYDGFKNMVSYLSSDSRVASIRYATFNYDVLNNLLSGQLVIRVYSLDAVGRDYEVPVITDPGSGKGDMFKD